MVTDGTRPHVPALHEGHERRPLLQVPLQTPVVWWVWGEENLSLPHMTTVWVVLLCLLGLLLLSFASGRRTDARPPAARTIMAYTQPWCGACKRLRPEWERLEALAGPDLAVVRVDCSSEDCASVSKYPTIVCNGAEYAGERTAEAMRTWALRM
ncbi:MAG: hypothetical protein EOO40_12370 [Deltaproteobacteria bacterium]|nr:MAG: hypothetical protein EOO40_12370 [Deltaproteobacteria bacterium]